ncbi:type II secretion system protein GspM [Castellaniella sp.]|uniref:type II secretion system protein GspM n=1 Tax=Castellaniella sp. TaxID=1955812 RepID=UPI002AFFC111|nr:type II secretion system protein GspM [Castellaniella sp.]
MTRFLTTWHASWLRLSGLVMTRAGGIWRGFSPRERRLLQVAGLLLAGLLIWGLGVRPALRTLDTVRVQLPTLQGQAASLDAIVLESQVLARSRHGSMTPEATDQALRDGLAQAGIVGTLTRESPNPAQITESGQRWTLQLSQVPAPALLAWLAGLPQMARVRVAQLALQRSHVDGRDRPGLLDGQVVLILPPESRP